MKTDPAVVAKIFECLKSSSQTHVSRCQRCHAKLVRVVSGTFHFRIFYRAVCSNKNCHEPQFVSGRALAELPLKEGAIDEFNTLVERPFTI